MERKFKELEGLSSLSIGDLADQLQEAKNAKSYYNAEIKSLNKRQAEIERALIELMEKQDIEKAAGTLCSVTMKVETRSSVKDKIAFVNWAVLNSRYEFLQSTVNQAPVREMMEQENKAPDGIETYIHKRINTRKKA